MNEHCHSSKNLSEFLDTCIIITIFQLLQLLYFIWVLYQTFFPYIALLSDSVLYPKEITQSNKPNG